MDTTVVAAFAKAAVSTFKDMFGLDATVAETRELSSADNHGWDITGLIGLAGQAQGVVAIRLSQSLVDSLLAGSGVTVGLGEEGRQLEGGLVGEITNIVAGQATSAIRSLDIEIAPPVIVRGPNHKIGWPNIAPVVAISLKMPSGGDVEIDLCIKH